MAAADFTRGLGIGQTPSAAVLVVNLSRKKILLRLAGERSPGAIWV
jgi:hypothetical protein